MRKNHTHPLDHWDVFWQKKADYEKVYSNEGRIAANLEPYFDVRGKRVLEVGSGTGRDSAELARQGAFVFVLDRSFKAMDIIRRLMKDRGVPLFPVIGDVAHLPFARGSFDLVFHQGLLEHFTDPLTVLSENHRILDKGGFILVDVPQRYHPYTLVKHVLMALGHWFAGWETEYTIDGLEDTVTRAGFAEIVHRYGTWMNPSFFYRTLREALIKVGIEMPLYPSSPSIIRKGREMLRKKLAERPESFYTFHTIGIIAKK
jgi:SAM-dependent methyltransferase